jgi:hypothetical protein
VPAQFIFKYSLFRRCMFLLTFCCIHFYNECMHVDTHQLIEYRGPVYVSPCHCAENSCSSRASSLLPTLALFTGYCCLMASISLWTWNFLIMSRGLNSGLHTWKACVLSLEPHLQSICLCLFWRWSLANHLPRLSSNCDPPNLNLPIS